MYQANTGASSRTGMVTIAGGGIIQTVTVTQAANSLTVSPTSRWVGSPSGSFEVAVTANVEWSVSTNNVTWFSASPTSGTGNGSFTVTYQANMGTTIRTGMVTVAGGGITSAINVLQESPLANGVSVPGIVDGTGGWKHYQIAVPIGASHLVVTITGGTGDADLYVRYGAQPTAGAYDYCPSLGGNNETVTITNPTSGNWYISLYAHNAYSGVTLTATYTLGLTDYSVWLAYYRVADTPENWGKWLAGLDPTNPKSQLVITSFSMSNGVPMITYSPSNLPGRVYVYEGTTNLFNTNSWGTNIPSPRYFRVRVGMQE